MRSEKIENKQTRFAKLFPNGEKTREKSDLQFRSWLLDAVSHSQKKVHEIQIKVDPESTNPKLFHEKEVVSLK